MLNKWQGIGRLGKDPELRYTPQGTAVLSMSMACETSYKSGNEWKKQTFWADIIIFGRRAESASQYLAKGSLAYVEGRLQTRSWEPNGAKHYKTEIIGDKVLFLDKRDKAAQETEYQEEITDLEPF
jgi:single-strand DNA-binding protein